MNRFSYLLICTIFVLHACYQSKNSATSAIDGLYKQLQSNPSIESAEIYLDSLTSFIAGHIDEKALIAPYLEKGVEVGEQYNMNHQALSFIMPLLRQNPTYPQRKEMIIRMANILYKNSSYHAADVVWKSLNRQFPDDQSIKEQNIRLDSIASVTDDYVQYLFDQVLLNPDKMGLNEAASQKYVDGVEALALVEPQNENIPLHLYRAGEIARQLRHLNKAMSIYDWILSDYPNYEKIPTILFIKGFTLEEDFDDQATALTVYKEFMQRFPEHNLAKSVEILIKNSGKSTEEILSEIERKNQQPSTN